MCGVWYVVRGVWCVVCWCVSEWRCVVSYMMRGVLCVVCSVRCVVCGVW